MVKLFYWFRNFNVLQTAMGIKYYIYLIRIANSVHCNQLITKFIFLQVFLHHKKHKSIETQYRKKIKHKLGESNNVDMSNSNFLLNFIIRI